MLRSASIATLLLTIACGQPSTLGRLDASLGAPKKPGEAYSLVRTSSDKDQIVSISVSDNYLFFATSWKGVYRLPKYGGPVEPVEEDADAVATVAANRDSVIWSRTTFGSGDAPYTQIKKRAAAGGASSIVLEASFSLPEINGNARMSATNNAVYLMSQDNGGLAPIEYRRLSLSGGAPTTLLSIPDLDQLPEAWLFQDDTLYYSQQEAGVTKLLQAKSDGSGTIEIAASASIGGSPLGADANSLYTTGKVGKYQGMVAVAKRDGAPTALDKSAGSASGAYPATFVVDDHNLYYMTNGPAASGPQVRSLPKVGGTPTVIGSGSQFDRGIGQIVQDDNNLYLLHSWNEILRLPKRPARWLVSGS
jgi:hypothetical protein